MKSVLLEFLSTDKETLIFVIRQDWQEKGIIDSQPLVFKANFNEADVDICVKEIRALYNEWGKKHYAADYVDKIKLEDRTSFYTIGEKIFNLQLMQSIEGYELIYFVPFSALHHLPLHAMKYQNKEIIDNFACSYLPSASILQFCNKSKERPTTFNLKGIGVDATCLRGVFISEVSELEKLTYFDKKKIYKEINGTRENFFLNNKKFNILHCSSHGYIAEDPLKSGIVLYVPEKLRPHLSIDSIHNTLNENSMDLLKESIINVHDLIKLNGSFELVFISACVSGENKNEMGDELMGLSRGLFYSGTKSMILSLFTAFKNKTGDPRVKGHVKEFYRFWIDEKQDKAKAFQNYIKILKKDEDHPFYWFSYILIGNPY